MGIAKVTGTLRTYYYSTKPGIVYGNAIHILAGFWLASNSSLGWLLVQTVLGSSLVIAGACVFNNVIDRKIDRKMLRTKNRALATRSFPIQNAVVYASLLVVLGFIVLLLYTNTLTALMGLVGLIFYVAIYGYYKRRSPYSTLVGSIAGAIPPVAGYTAVTNKFDLGAALIVLLLICWQMPHFYAIALRRKKDYLAAGLPVMPLVKGSRRTVLEMFLYAVGYVATTIALWSFGYTNLSYTIVMTLIGAWWCRLAYQGLREKNIARWAHKMFRFSLIITIVFSVMSGLIGLLP